jgi:hypothetical protein
MKSQEAHEFCEEYHQAFNCLKTKGKDPQPNKDGVKAFRLLKKISTAVATRIIDEIKRWDPSIPRAQWSKPNAATLIIRLEDEANKYTAPTWLKAYKHGDVVYFIDKPHIMGIVDKESEEPVILVAEPNKFGATYVKAVPADRVKPGAIKLAPIEEFEKARENAMSGSFSGYSKEWFRFILDDQYWHKEMVNDAARL